ncbi:hypothetical protein [Pseudomonas guariconensis]|uniref:hypothetical protein n=1 Tax=Pseudomonas guariconensis TaxID=1288410 RepID=UPI001E63AA73|nr:hypothetical protein [Pseudomonas guariconensis]
MMSWGRSTPWRQGHLVSRELLTQLGIDSENDTVAVIATHDCDLAQSATAEPEVELILGKLLDSELNGNYTHCKNIRRLHIPLTGAEQHQRIELDTGRRIRVPKEHSDPSRSLASYEPSRDVLMSGIERGIFQRWLAARYRRSSFPDEFDRRLKDQTKVAERLAKVFKDSGNHIPAVFFDVDMGVERLRDGEDDLYELSITVLYSTDDDPEMAETAAWTAAKAIQEIFESRCKAGRNGPWKWIELTEISVISDEALTYGQSLQLTRWQADHISLRTDPEQPIFDER